MSYFYGRINEKDSDAEVLEKAPLGDRLNMLFSGCSITYGRGVAIVARAGMNTEMSKIANLLNDEHDETTPLQKKLLDLGKKLGIVALLICAVIFVIGLAFVPIIVLEIAKAFGLVKTNK